MSACCADYHPSAAPPRSDSCARSAPGGPSISPWACSWPHRSSSSSHSRQRALGPLLVSPFEGTIMSPKVRSRLEEAERGGEQKGRVDGPGDFDPGGAGLRAERVDEGERRNHGDGRDGAPGPA